MPKATGRYGELQILAKCFIDTPWKRIDLRILPDVTDTKSANYSSEAVTGRTNPVVNYSYSEPRSIQTDIHFMVTQCEDIQRNLEDFRCIKALVYPGTSNGAAPYSPPPVCKFQCGSLLGDFNSEAVCVVLRNYNVRFGTDVPWDVETYLPYRFTISCQWEVVYACSDLPTNNVIRQLTAATDVTCPPNRIDLLGPPPQIGQ